MRACPLRAEGGHVGSLRNIDDVPEGTTDERCSRGEVTRQFLF